MCGILGGSWEKWNYEGAMQIMRHRGPDAQRMVRMRDFTFAFVRLSIMDLSDNGMQPMFTDDGKIGLVFNGEIYGYKKLRSQLVNRGYQFKSTSDTEVVLYAYCEWGDKFIERIDGMFAIAIYDKERQEIHLFRDRAGIKPVYYYFDGYRFAFASELKGIEVMCNDCQFVIDNTAIYDYLVYQYIPEPKSMYQQVYKLEPATELIYSISGKKITSKKTYWTLKANANVSGKITSQEAESHVRELIHKSVKEQLEADVPVGTFLSGGLDSSIVTCEVNSLNREIEAFSMGFPEKTYDETEYARKVAEYLGIKFHRYEMSKEDFQDAYQKLRTWYDEPFGDSTAYPNYLISKAIRSKVKVALSGDGGDEVFGGYGRYRDFAEKEKYNINSRSLAKCYKKIGWDRYLPKKMNRIFYDDVEEYAYVSGFALEHHVDIHAEEVRKKLGIPKDYDPYWNFRQYYERDLPRITMAQYIDFHSYLPAGMLTKVDRTSMAVSLEVRVPLLSREIIEYAFSLPEEIRCTQQELKRILKEAYTASLPEDILYRKKKGFTTPEFYYRRAGLNFRERVLRDLWKIKAV